MNSARVELPCAGRLPRSVSRPGSGGDDGFARGIDQDGNVAVAVSLKKGSAGSGQAVFKVAP
jgi:hypothetical protein